MGVRRLRPMFWVYLVILVLLVGGVVVPAAVRAAAAGQWRSITAALAPLVVVLSLAFLLAARVRRQIAPPPAGQPHPPGSVLDVAFFGLLVLLALLVVSIPLVGYVKDQSTEEIPSTLFLLALIAALPFIERLAVRRGMDRQRAASRDVSDGGVS